MPKVPPLPNGMTPAEFGHDVMKWGTGDDAALDRISTLTKDELAHACVTSEMALAWQAFYLDVIRQNPKNPSAAGRAKLMQHVAALLVETEAS